MRNAYVEVLKSYWTRSVSSWGLAIPVLAGVFQILMSIVTLFSREKDIYLELGFFFAGQLFLGLLLWAHFQDQVVSEFRRLWPGYAGPQVCGFAIYSIMLVVVWPRALGILDHVSWISLVGIAAFCFALEGWWILTMSWWAIGVGILLWMYVFFGAVFGMAEPIVKSLLNGSQVEFTVGMLLIGMGAATVVVVRMVAMKEENGLYHRRPQMDNWSLRPRMTGDVNRAWSDAQRSRLFGWPGLGNQVVIPRTNSLWAGARRWRSLNGGMPKGVVLLAVMMFAGTLLGIRNAQANVGAALPLCIWLSIVPASAAGQLWMRQWRFLEIELLRPIERRRFLQEVGLAMGVTFAQCWGVFAAAFVLRLGVLTPEPLNVTTILLVLGSSLLMQIFLLGSIIWLMRYRSPGLVIGASLLAILIALPTLILTLPGGMMGMPHFGEFQMPAVVAATVLAGIGLVITRDACRRWLVTELG